MLVFLQRQQAADHFWTILFFDVDMSRTKPLIEKRRIAVNHNRPIMEGMLDSTLGMAHDCTRLFRQNTALDLH